MAFFFFSGFAVTSVFNTVQNKEAMRKHIMFKDSLTYLKKMNLLPVMKEVSLWVHLNAVISLARYVSF